MGGQDGAPVRAADRATHLGTTQPDLGHRHSRRGLRSQDKVSHWETHLPGRVKTGRARVRKEGAGRSEGRATRKVATRQGSRRGWKALTNGENRLHSSAPTSDPSGDERRRAGNDALRWRRVWRARGNRPEPL